MDKKQEIEILNKLMEDVSKSGLKNSGSLAGFVKKKYKFLGKYDSPEELTQAWNDAIVESVDRNNMLSDEDKIAYYGKYNSNPNFSLDFGKMLESGELKMGEGLDPNTRLKLTAKYKVSPEQFNKSLTEARGKWNAEQQAKVPAQIAEGRMKELQTGWDPNDSFGSNIAKKVVEFGLPRSIETARQQVANGQAPEISPWAIGGDFGEWALGTGLGAATKIPAAAKGLGKLGKTMMEGGTLGRIGNIASHIGGGAALDAAGTGIAEGIAAQDENYEANPYNVLASGIGSAVVPAGLNAITGVGNLVPQLHKYTEKLDKIFKTAEDLPAAQRMDYDFYVKEMKKGLEALNKMDPVTQANDIARKNAELIQLGNEFDAKYPEINLEQPMTKQQIEAAGEKAFKEAPIVTNANGKPDMAATLKGRYEAKNKKMAELESNATPEKQGTQIEQWTRAFEEGDVPNANAYAQQVTAKSKLDAPDLKSGKKEADFTSEQQNLNPVGLKDAIHINGTAGLVKGIARPLVRRGGKKEVNDDARSHEELEAKAQKRAEEEGQKILQRWADGYATLEEKQTPEYKQFQLAQLTKWN